MHREPTLRQHLPALRDWVADLGTSAEGPTVVRNLEQETALYHSVEGQPVLAALVNAIAGWHTHRSVDAFNWLGNELRTSCQQLLCQGRTVPAPPSDTLCRVTSLRNVHTHHRKDAARGPRAAFGSATSRRLDETRLRDWGRTFLSNPTRRLRTLDPDSRVRGQLPMVFALPREDCWPTGTSVVRILELLGIQERSQPVVDQCLQSFCLSSIGPGCVPTGLDAFTNRYFRSVRANAGWGRTRDLADATGQSRGPRECVAREFPAREVLDWEVLEA